MPNLLLQSRDFTTTWVTGGDATATANEATDPDGSTQADRATFSAGGGNRIEQTIGARVGVHTYSIFAKQDTASHINLRVFESAGVDIYNDFNLVTAVSTGSNSSRAPIDAGVIPMANDWRRLYITGLFDGDANLIVRVGGEILSTSSGTAAFIYGANFEPGLLGNYVPTTTASSPVDSVNTRGRTIHKRSQF